MQGDGRLRTLRLTLRGGLEERITRTTPSRQLRLALTDSTVTELLGMRPLRVLDAGCGDGLLSLALANRHRFWELLGLDYGEALLAAARHRAAACSLANVSFQQADLTRPLPARDFDVAMAIECLTEIPQDREAVNRIATALRPGGLFVVHVPDSRWKPILPGSAATWRHEVRHGYNAGQLEAMLLDAGLRDVTITPTYRSLAAIAQEIRDRCRNAPLALRAALVPLLAAAVALERRGLTWGSANAMLATAWAPETA